MTFQSVALATPNLLALWMMTDAAGATTAADLGPNNLPLTYSAAKVDGVENVQGAGTGMSASAGYASRAVSSGSTLAPTAAETICGWITPSAFGVATTVAGRNNHFRILLQASGSLGLQAWTGSVLQIQAGVAATAGLTYFIAIVFNGVTAKVYINGALLQESVRVGTLAAVADTFRVSTDVNPMPGTISGVGVWGRALGAGEIQELWLAGTKVAAIGTGIVIDNLYDDDDATIAAAGQGARCAVCHGTRRANEPSITRGVDVHHPACFAAKGLTKTPTVTTSSTPYPDYEGQLLRGMHLLLTVQSERVTSVTKPIYYDGSRVQPTGSVSAGAYDVFGPWALTPALLARHTRMPKQHWMIDMAISQVNFIWTLQNSQGNLVQTGLSGGVDFVMCQLAEAILFLEPYVDRDTLAEWKLNLAKVGTYLITYPVGRPESEFYVNGNREAGELLGWWMLWEALGDTRWYDLYQEQYEFLINPPAHSGGVDLEGNDTYGLVIVTEPTEDDGSDGKAYLIERTSSRVGTVTGPDHVTVLNGHDPNYSSLCDMFLARLWLYSRDPRILRILNMQHNLVMDRANMTGSTIGDVPSWVLDGRGGSRQNNSSAFNTGVFGVLGYAAEQARITQAQMSGSFNIQIQEWINLAASSTLSRDVNVNGGLWLMSLPTWPGI